MRARAIRVVMMMIFNANRVIALIQAIVNNISISINHLLGR